MGNFHLVEDVLPLAAPPLSNVGQALSPRAGALQQYFPHAFHCLFVLPAPDRFVLKP